LVCGTAGFDGTQFKGLLASKYSIQLNKTSRNSVLFQTNINNTLSDVAHLLKVLGEIARDLDEQLTRGTDGERAAFKARVKSLMEDVPDLPNFTGFHDSFRENPASATIEGDMRAGFYAAYDEAGCEYLPLNSPDVDARLATGPRLVSASFVIPYPPGFPIMVPGQVLDLADWEVDLLPPFPVRRRLRRRAAVRPGRRQGWPAASDFLGGPLRVLPGHSRRGREGRRIRRGLRGGAVRGIADDLGLDGPRDGRHQPTRLTHGPGQRPPRRDADRLRRKLYLWHRRLGDRDRAGGAGVAPHQPSCRLQGL